MCRLHSRVVSGVAMGEEVSRSFPGTLEETRGVRPFIAQALVSWDRDDLVDECFVVGTELATNAVRHAGSDFTVVLSYDAHDVHVHVQDASAAPPMLRRLDPKAPDGRGLQLVDAIARRWGHTATPTGKSVWAVVGAAG
jgi:anti-sigma regulatory factor (Ser/Thr protein kinase)